jgi:hypothetical protein
MMAVRFHTGLLPCVVPRGKGEKAGEKNTGKPKPAKIHPSSPERQRSDNVLTFSPPNLDYKLDRDSRMTLKSVLITGTSIGIGEAAAQYFLQRGAHLPLDAGSP